MSEKQQTPMSPEDAARIQRNADKTDKTDGFKERAQRAGEKNANEGKVPTKK